MALARVLVRCGSHARVVGPQMLRNEEHVLEVLNSRPGHIIGATLYVAESAVALSNGDAWAAVAAAFARWTSTAVGGDEADASSDGESVHSDTSDSTPLPPRFTRNTCCDEDCVATKVRCGRGPSLVERQVQPSPSCGARAHGMGCVAGAVHRDCCRQAPQGCSGGSGGCSGDALRS